MDARIVVAVGEQGADPERLDTLAYGLRDELLALDVDDVQPFTIGAAPPGTRGLELAAVGALVVTLNTSADLVAKIVSTVRGWLGRAPEPTRTVEVTIGDRSLTLTAASREEQERLVAQFLAATGPASGGGDG